MRKLILTPTSLPSLSRWHINARGIMLDVIFSLQISMRSEISRKRYPQGTFIKDVTQKYLPPQYNTCNSFKPLRETTPIFLGFVSHEICLMTSCCVRRSSWLLMTCLVNFPSKNETKLYPVCWLELSRLFSTSPWAVNDSQPSILQLLNASRT